MLPLFQQGDCKYWEESLGERFLMLIQWKVPVPSKEPLLDRSLSGLSIGKTILKYYFRLYCSKIISAHQLLQCNITYWDHICFSLLLKHWVFRVGAVRRSGPTPDRWFWHGCPGLLQPGRGLLKLWVLRLGRGTHCRRQQPSRLTRRQKRRPKNPGNSVYIRKEKLPPQARLRAKIRIP